MNLVTAMTAFALMNLTSPSIGPDYVLVETERYSFEVPAGWEVGKITPWGARDIEPSSRSGKLGAMTAGPTKASWDELYRTSLYFIKREEEGKETAFRLGKTKMGFESMSYEVINKAGFADRRYTLLKNEIGSALALSVKIPSAKLEKEYVAHFKRMVDSAILK
jgi:hypothetical protein